MSYTHYAHLVTFFTVAVDEQSHEHYKHEQRDAATSCPDSK